MSTPNTKNTAARPGSSGRAAAARNAAPDADALPGPEAVYEALAPIRDFMRDPAFARVRGFLDRLSRTPPQVLLLEGGSAESRLAAAHYWAALLNCDGEVPAPSGATAMSLPGLPDLPRPPASGAPLADGTPPPVERPCLACPACIRMATHLHRDFFFLDGVAGSIKIDDVRAMRGVLGEPPREASYRVCVFREAQSLMEAAANALLKSFEEPRPGTSFVLLAPQRERLLPTLVSRGFTLTLPWPCAEDGPEDDLAPWEAALVSFLRTGRGFFEKSGAKGTVDAPLTHAVTGLCRRALLKRLQSGPDAGAEGLEGLLAPVAEPRLRILDEALAECQESLIYGVNPVLVLEWLATRMYFLVPRKHA